MATKHESGPVTRKDVEKAGGSLAKVYRERAEAGDVGAQETTKRVAESSMEARRKKPGTSIFHQRSKLLNETLD